MTSRLAYVQSSPYHRTKFHSHRVVIGVGNPGGIGAKSALVLGGSQTKELI
jgi:hypothetical protein